MFKKIINFLFWFFGIFLLTAFFQYFILNIYLSRTSVLFCLFISLLFSFFISRKLKLLENEKIIKPKNKYFLYISIFFIIIYLLFNVPYKFNKETGSCSDLYKNYILYKDIPYQYPPMDILFENSIFNTYQ